MLRIATGQPGLSLPEEAVTQKFAILAVSGRGKTYTASVMAEEMLDHQLPVVIVDPLGAWWGLRSSADGKRPGHPVVIFGGSHADVPLEPTAGRLIADVVVQEHVPCVIDLSSFDSKSQEIQFMTDFLTRLYRTNRDPLHVFIDEADEFAPQQAFPEGKRLLGAMEQLVRRGRLRGLGCTLISQRPAVLNKNVLSQVETLVLLGLTGMNDLKAIDDWVGKYSDSTEAAGIKKSLPGLDIGTAWVWSPAWLKVTRKVKIRKRKTFDSSATPKVGQQKIQPKRFAQVDLEALGERIAATVEAQQASDPKVLQRRVLDLQNEVLGLHHQLEEKPEPKVEQVEVSVFTDEDREMVSLLGKEVSGALPSLRLLEGLQGTIEKVLGMPVSGDMVEIPLSRDVARQRGALAPPVGSPNSGARPAVKQTAALPVRRDGAGPGQKMAKAERAVLTVLAQYGPRTKSQLGLLAGYAIGGGSFNNALGRLRSSKHIEGGNSEPMAITQAGLDALGPFEPLPTGWALVEHHSARLPKAAKEIIGVLWDCAPQGLTKVEIAERTPTKYEPGGGSFNNALGRLRSLELVKTSSGINTLAEVLLS